MTPTERRRAFVTGGGSGIGVATCRRLAADGFHVVVAELDEVAAKEVAAEVAGDAVALDVCDVRAVRDAVAAWQPVDVLVNNAGGDRMAFLLETDERDWDAALSLNLKGVIACTHAVLPGMQERRRGVIVNMASEAGRTGVVGGAVSVGRTGGSGTSISRPSREKLVPER